MPENRAYTESSIAFIVSVIIHILLCIVLFILHINYSDGSSSSYTFEEQSPMVVVELEDTPHLSAAMQQPKPTPAPAAPEFELAAMSPSGSIGSYQKQEEPEHSQPDTNEHAKNESHQEVSTEKIEDLIELASQLLGEPQPIEKAATTAQRTESIKKTEKDTSPKKSPLLDYKAKPTLAQLAGGFMNHMAQQGPMEVKSNKTGPATIEQITHINYCQKIIGCLVNSYKINRPSRTLAQTQRSCIKLSLNKNGSIHGVSLIQSSGNYETDTFLVKIFTDAGTSFPPVPDILKQAPFSLPLFTIDSISAFQTTEGWYIDNGLR